MGFQGLKKVPSGSPAGQVDFLACLTGKGPGKSSSYKIINLLTSQEQEAVSCCKHNVRAAACPKDCPASRAFFCFFLIEEFVKEALPESRHIKPLKSPQPELLD